MAKGSAPEVLALNPTQLEELLVKLAGLLPAETYQLVETLLRTLQWVMGVLEAKNTTLGRLRRMIFGAQTEKSRNLLAQSDAAAASAKTPDPKPKAKGHGRKAAQDYSGAKRLPVPHPKLRLRDLCPKCLKGKLYLLKTPARIVRIAAQPMYRTDKWQNYLGVPLAASTQWELMAAASKTPAVVYEALIEVAAQDPDPRTGIFTTSIIARVGPVPVALFFTGQKHAGENLDPLLQSREANRSQPLQMCDALSRNEPKEFHTLLCRCILHARRNFIDVGQSFPEECRQVIESLREIYRVDALAKERKLSDLERLAFHQEHSQPVMDQLRQWMKEQLEQKKVEPNSGLGEAINYMLKRWETLTRFLSVPGAPLDNNITERALKTAILHRRNSLSYKTLNGARIGDIHMSLIHTCELNGVNPFDYFMALEQHAEAVAKAPSCWFPWNYRQAIEAADSS